MVGLYRKSVKKPFPQHCKALIAAIFIAYGALAGGVVGAAGLPNLGDAGDISPGAERRLGDRIARELYRDPDYLDDPVIMDYVQGIWQPLLAAARQRGDLQPELDEAFAFEILLGRDRTVNAFALPGAYMGLHLGLVAVVTSRDELASVLAHELSHVTQRHISRMMNQQSQMAPWLIGSMILGALAASKDPSAANAVLMGGQAAATQTQLNFSRDMEREADRTGFGVSTQAGFEPQGFVSMFEKLQQASRLNDSGNFPYLRSHPLTTERMADMQARIPLGAKSSSVLQMDHAMVAARARVLAFAGVDDLRAWSNKAQAQHLAALGMAQQAGVLYGSTLAAMKQRDYAAAQGYSKRLQQLTDSDPTAKRLARWLAAELSLAQGDAAQAQRVLGSGTNGRAELFLAAQIAARNPANAGAITQKMQTWVAEHPRDAQAWQLLANLNAAQGRTLAAIRAEAEVNVAHMDYAAALDRLTAAQNLARGRSADGVDHIEASIVDTRTREVQKLLKEQALER
jgi:predicted Zn-dependent protease